MLTGKQKRYLRALATKERAVFQIGKEGLSHNLFKTVSDYLEAHELVKVSVLKTCDTDFDELAFDLAMYTESEVVQKIGRTIVLRFPEISVFNRRLPVRGCGDARLVYPLRIPRFQNRTYHLLRLY